MHFKSYKNYAKTYVIITGRSMGLCIMYYEAFSCNTIIINFCFFVSLHSLLFSIWENAHYILKWIRCKHCQLRNFDLISTTVRFAFFCFFSLFPLPWFFFFVYLDWFKTSFLFILRGPMRSFSDFRFACEVLGFKNIGLYNVCALWCFGFDKFSPLPVC